MICNSIGALYELGAVIEGITDLQVHIAKLSEMTGVSFERVSALLESLVAGELDEKSLVEELGIWDDETQKLWEEGERAGLC